MSKTIVTVNCYNGSRVFWIMIEVTNLLQISEGFLGKPQPTHENKGKHKGGVCVPLVA